MGLDQYLSASKYVSDSEFRDDNTREAFSAVLAAVNGEGFVGGMVPTATITLSVGYWRKANQVHGWFVNNCGGGVDECQRMYVTREHLTDLLNTCLTVKAGGAEVAAELLPPSDGFFFGSNEIDEWYWQDIDNTIEQLGRILEQVPADWDFQYQASW